VARCRRIAGHDASVSLTPVRARLVTLAIVGVALALRLWGIRHGLPFAYYGDENWHFVRGAVLLFDDFEPPKFINPSGLTELLFAVDVVWYRGGGAARHALATEPGSIFLLGRLVCALLGTAGVWLLVLAGRRLLGAAAGALAGALLAVAFLPVYFSHLALDDGPTVAPVALCLLGVAGIVRRGRIIDFALAGVGGGLAAGTKYNAGFVLLAAVGASTVIALDGRRRVAAVGLAIVALSAGLAFLVTTPYALLDHERFLTDLRLQRRWANSGVLVGETQSSGYAYYAWALTWGFGWLPLAAALGGAIRMLARDRRLAAVLLPAPLVLFGFMGGQFRYFGRWMVPVVPMLCLLAAYGAVQLVDAIAWRRPQVRPAGFAAAAVLLLAQGIITAVHVDRVLTQPDTRDTARAWLFAHVPQGSGVVLEPFLPTEAATIGNHWLVAGPPGTARKAGWARHWRLPHFHYQRTLRPSLIDAYERLGYCWVIAGSTQTDLAYVGEWPERHYARARAYYRRLAREATVVHQDSPFAPRAAPIAPGQTPVRYQGDWSFDYYPAAYRLPGPVITFYRLHGGRCRAPSATALPIPRPAQSHPSP
jgi:hypothetical protein